MTDDKDRRTRMIHSSMKAPPKKDGAGGQFTWGGVMDVTNYEPVGLGGSAQTVIVGPAYTTAAPMQPAVAQSFQLAGTDFPSLVLGANAPATTMLPLQIGTRAVAPRWGPAPPVAPPNLNAQNSLRGGVAGTGPPIFDAQHPRNQFARKPYHGAPIPVVELACSSPKESRTKISEVTNPAHVSPFVQKLSSEPLTQKQLETIAGSSPKFSPAMQVNNQPFMNQQFAKQQRSRGVIHQPSGRH